MGNRVTSVRIKRPDGTYSNEIPISPSADKVIWKDNEHNLEEILGNVDTTKPIQNQINQKVNTAELQEYIDTEMADDVGDWLEEHVIIPSGGTVAVDNTLSISEAAADAKTVGDIVHESIAPKFNSLLDYKIGDCVFYENHFYKFIKDHAAGAWNATHVEVADDLAKQVSTKAEQDGYYSDMTVGDAEQLVATEFIEDDELYTFRKAGGNYDIGNRQYDQLEGGTICWNQLVNHLPSSTEQSGITIVNNNDGSFTINGTTEARIYITTLNNVGINGIVDHIYYLHTGAQQLTIHSMNWAIENLGLSDCIAKAHDLASSNMGFALQIMSANLTFNNIKVCPQIFDLTAMFGSTIADYIYSLEQANQGDGVAWFKKYFPKDYYAYDPGSLQSVNVASHDTVGFNQWDEEWELGIFDDITGVPQTRNDRIRTKNNIQIIPDTIYNFTCGVENAVLNLFWLDINGNVISKIDRRTNTTATSPSNAKYLKFYVGSVNITTYNHDICINLSDPSRNGDYEPYNKNSYPYDSSLQLRGIPKLVDGKLTYDGDIYQSNGTVTRKYGIVDLGTLTWEKIDTSSGHWRFQAQKTDVKRTSTSGSTPYILCSKYQGITPDDSWVGTSTGITINNASSYILVCDGNYSSASDFKTAMSGAMLVYELATPTTETAAPFVYSQEVDNYGTEEYIDAGVLATTRDVSVPVGHHTKYPPNLRDKLQHLPFLADEDGDYYIQQSNKKMALKKMEGDFENIVAGSAKQLLSDSYVEDSEPYVFRTAGGSASIGDRLEEEIVGGSIVWNQLVENGNFASVSIWVAGNATYTVSNNIATIIPKPASSSSYLSLPNIHRQSGNKYLMLLSYKKDSTNSSDAEYLQWYNGSSWNSWSATNDTSWHDVAKILTFSGIDDDDMIRIARNYANGDMIEYKNVQLFDLTAMFGTEIADYIYSLEQANEGDGVAWFKKYFPKDYYEYNAGELMHVSGLSEHKTVGFNQWDEEWEVGAVSALDGIDLAGTTTIRSKNYIPVFPNTSYYAKWPWAGNVRTRFYDADKNYLGYVQKDGSQVLYNSVFVTPEKCHYMRFQTTDDTGTTYNHNICINLSDPAKNGTYEPYKGHSYPLDDSLTLRGIPKLDSNNKLYYDGDRYLANGVVERRYGIVDLSTLEWTYLSDTTRFTSQDIKTAIKKPSSDSVRANIICSAYIIKSLTTLLSEIDNALAIGDTGVVSVKNSSYTDAATFKTAMSGVYLIYELATPTTETAQPYQEIQIVDNFGTEEYVINTEDDVIIPVGHNTKYPADLKSKLEMVPESPNGNGDYIVRQTDGTNTYVPLVIPSELPTLPTENGNYILRVTVDGTIKTLSWVAQS